ncbi:hypothetical protein NESM_000504000 [Novymonas esmeraldas]|uniref:Uncharacterized protein n=1 Tax=Novymonas esmeraldas TaxID=1808958 RepID=A0AAW0ENX5_9TRYP
MGSKQAPRDAAKHTSPTSGKGRATVLRASTEKATTGTGAAAVRSTAATDVDDVASLFSAIRKTPTQRHGGTATVVKASSKHTPTRSSTSASSGATAKPVRDGLYRAPEKSVQMSDNQFFSGTWLKEDRSAAGACTAVVASSAVAAEASEEQLRTEGVDRIVSMEELSKMLSRSARAGTTANCPFDCDCCF